MRPFSRVLGIAILALVWPSSGSAGLAPTIPTFQFAFGHSGSGNTQFFLPSAAITDITGNIYVVDTNNDRIQKFNYLGNFLSKFGASGSGNGQLNTPYGIAIDGPGNLYVLDSGNNRVEKFTSGGVYLSQWGALGGGAGQFSFPQGIAIDAEGNVYVADSGNHRIQKFNSNGFLLTQWGSGGSGDGQFNNPGRVAVSPSGDIYVTDSGNNRIQVFTKTGTFLRKWGSPGSGAGAFSGPNGITVDLVGNVYVAEAGNERVQKFSSTGEFLTIWGSTGSGNGQFSGPAGIFADGAGNLLVADRGNHRIQKFSGAGVALAQAPPIFQKSWYTQGGGSPWGIATDGQLVYVALFNSNRIEAYNLQTGAFVRAWGTTGTQMGQLQGPTGIAVGPNGLIYVSEFYNNRIQVFNSLGNPLLLWGLPGSGNAFFNSPTGIDVNATTIFVADAGNNRIQKFDLAGNYTGQWGSPYGSGDGQFSTPIDVAVDAAGIVYVADRDNHRVQRFTSSGSYISKWGSLGSGNGQFNHPYGVATGLDGNVYVADHDNGRIQVFTTGGGYLSSVAAGQGRGMAVDPYGGVYTCLEASDLTEQFIVPPAVSLLADIGNDQGRQIQLGFHRTSADANGTGITVTGYEIYRRMEGVPAPDAADRDLRDQGVRPELSGWSYLFTLPAHGESETNVVVPSLADANATSAYYSSYLVRATTSNPFVYYDGGADVGYSVDNLPPATPTPFTAAYAAGATHLHWGVSGESDFSSYRLYRGTSADFVPSSGNLVASTPDTGYTDVGDAGGYYKLSAVDLNGNESPFALVSPSTTVDAPGPTLPRSVELASPFPNPMRHGGRFHFALPRAMPVHLQVFDAAGRKVRNLLDGLRPAGASSVAWDGRDDSGRELSSGWLVLRLTADGRVLTQRLLNLR